MTTEKSKKTPDKRREYDDAFKAEALRLAVESRSTQAASQQVGISPKLCYRWQEAKRVAEVGSVKVARDPEVRRLRAQLKRAEQEPGILKKALASRCSLFFRGTISIASAYFTGVLHVDGRQVVLLQAATLAGIVLGVSVVVRFVLLGTPLRRLLGIGFGLLLVHHV